MDGRDLHGRGPGIEGSRRRPPPRLSRSRAAQGAGAKLLDYAKQTGVDALGLDETIDPIWAAEWLPEGMPLQGNLDPLALAEGGEQLHHALGRILAALAGRPHIMNLGHGIIPETPIAHVEEALRIIRGARFARD